MLSRKMDNVPNGITIHPEQIAEQGRRRWLGAKAAEKAAKAMVVHGWASAAAAIWTSLKRRAREIPIRRRSQCTSGTLQTWEQALRVSHAGSARHGTSSSALVMHWILKVSSQVCGDVGDAYSQSSENFDFSGRREISWDDRSWIRVLTKRSTEGCWKAHAVGVNHLLRIELGPPSSKLNVAPAP